MFDSPTSLIAEYAAGLDPAQIPEAATDAMRSRLVDALGCALGALDAPPCSAARSIAATATADPGASVIGLPVPSTPELAAFANGCLVRYLDFNDTYHTEGGGHPSDMAGAVLAAAEISGRSGREVLAGLHVAYEVFAALADAVPMRDHGWDYGAFLAIATAAGTGRVLGLDVERLANAVSLAMTPNMPLFVTRTGELSNWKGCASAYAAMAALFAARLAAVGVTGPPKPFEGKFGLWEQATGPFDLAGLGVPVNGLSAVERTSCKLNPSDFETQIPAEVFGGLHADGVRPDEVEAIAVSTYYVAWDLIGGGQGDHDEKWDPQRRETADHSLPYVIAVALTDGRVTKASFAADRVGDPALRPLMRRITVAEDPEITRTWTSKPAYDFAVSLRDGRTLRIRVDHPRGHFNRPMSDQDCDEKFLANAGSAVDTETAHRLLALLRRIDDKDNLTGLMGILRGVEPPQARPDE
jgi:2-methylcitrate dehydratase